jgi:hypothetical protein
VKRGAKALDRKDELEFRRYREAGVKFNDCCKLYNISRATGFRILAKLRREFGPEKLPNRQLARARLRPEEPIRSTWNVN